MVKIWENPYPFRSYQENPFYSNHLFKEQDIHRFTYRKWNRIWMWLFPTYIQISDKYVFYYKVIGAKYWLLKTEELNLQEGEV